MSMEIGQPPDDAWPASVILSSTDGHFENYIVVELNPSMEYAALESQMLILTHVSGALSGGKCFGCKFDFQSWKGRSS